jgi:hypothetical protein
MSLTPHQGAHRGATPSRPSARNLGLSHLKLPKPTALIASALEPHAAAHDKQPEANPSHFAPENPTNRELAKERWYTRAAWASTVIGYSAALFTIRYGDSPAATPATATGLCIDSLFAYWAIKNSEMRTAILDGNALPHPTHSDPTIRRLFAIGALSSLIASCTNAIYCIERLLHGDYVGLAVRSASALVSLHQGCAWLRRARFFGSIDSQ